MKPARGGVKVSAKPTGDPHNMTELLSAAAQSRRRKDYIVS